MLLAIDGNQRIVGANPAARTSLLLDDRGLRAGVSLWTIFERDLDLFRRKDRTDIYTRLLVAGSHDSRPAFVTPPHHTMGASGNLTNLHTRPRLGSIQSPLKLAPALQTHGGLSAGAMRRVREYMEVHLGKASICQCWLEPPDCRCIILRDSLSNPSVSPRTSLPHAKAGRTRPGDVGSDRSLVIGDCLCRRLFRPKPSRTPFPSNARYYATGISVIAALANRQHGIGQGMSRTAPARSELTEVFERSATIVPIPTELLAGWSTICACPVPSSA
jgi:hypothetical protein